MCQKTWFYLTEQIFNFIIFVLFGWFGLEWVGVTCFSKMCMFLASQLLHSKESAPLAKIKTFGQLDTTSAKSILKLNRQWQGVWSHIVFYFVIFLFQKLFSLKYNCVIWRNITDLLVDRLDIKWVKTVWKILYNWHLWLSALHCFINFWQRWCILDLSLVLFQSLIDLLKKIEYCVVVYYK